MATTNPSTCGSAPKIISTSPRGRVAVNTWDRDGQHMRGWHACGGLRARPLALPLPLKLHQTAARSRPGSVLRGFGTWKHDAPRTGGCGPGLVAQWGSAAPATGMSYAESVCVSAMCNPAGSNRQSSMLPDAVDCVAALIWRCMAADRLPCRGIVEMHKASAMFQQR